jgi:hypothetical protein
MKEPTDVRGCPNQNAGSTSAFTPDAAIAS